MQTSSWHNVSATGTVSAMWSGDDDRRRVERSYLRYAGVGVQYALTILAFTAAGIWLDGKWGTSPLFTVVFLLVAFVGATWSLVATVLGPDDDRGRKQ
jgi:F0F1-type ATP synthase assembly protein I